MCLFYAVVKERLREKNKLGGDKEDRTPDLLLARQALSQLSYAPIISGGPRWTRTIDLTLIRRAL